MTEIIHFYRSSGSGWALRCAAVASVLLLSGAMNAATSQQESAASPVQIKAGQPVAREVRGGEHHSYELRLSAGQHARIVLEQKGIDVVLTLLGADGKPLLEVDNNLSGTRGMEMISVVAEAGGAFVFNVRPFEKDASAGRYELRIEELRVATEADRKRVSAERVYFAGVKLQGGRTPESNRKALEQYGEALRLMREAGDRRGEAMTLTNMGSIYHLSNEPQKSLEHSEQALVLWRAIGDPHLEAIAFTIKGRALYALGEPQKALEFYSRALPALRAVGDQSGEAGTFTQMGTVYRLFGEPQKALDHYEQALPLWRAVGDRLNEAVLRNNMGTVYNLLNDRQKALNFFQQALPLARAVEHSRNEAAILINTGHVYNLLNEPQKALEYLEQALVIARKNNDRRIEAGALTHTGTAYFALKDEGKAIEILERALQLRIATNDRQGEANTLNHIGRVSLAKDPKKAFAYYERALAIWSAMGDRNGEVAALFGMARAESDLDDPARASKRTEAALKIISTLRTTVASRNLRASYFASLHDLYKLHIDLLMRLHRRQPTAGYDVAALKTYEQARARSLIDMLTESSADIRQGVDPALLARELSLQQMLNFEADRQMRLFSSQPSEQAMNAVRRRIEELLTQLLAIEAELKSRSPRYTALTQPAPLDLTEIQTAVTDKETLLLEYSLGEERSYLWAVTATSFSSYELPPRSVIEAAARRCYDLLTARNSFVKFETADEKRTRVQQADAEYPSAAAALSNMLLGPVAAQLGRKRLLVVPDGALEYVPFAALTLPGQTARVSRQNTRPSRPGSANFVPLVVNHEVTSIPSASTLAVLRRELRDRAPAEKVVAVFADPVFDKTDERITGEVSRAPGGAKVSEVQDAVRSSDGATTLVRLPYTRHEAESILALAPPAGRKAAIGFEANRAAAMSDDLSEYRIIHFATHSFLDSTHPELSSIALSMLDR